LSASLSLIPNPSYLSPSFAVRRVEVYRHLNGLVERRRVEPIANRPGTSRVFRPREYVDEAPEKPAGTGSERLAVEYPDRRLRADYEFQFGDEIDNERPVRVRRLLKLRTLAPELGLALAQQPADEALKGLRQRGIRDVALVLIELAGGEKAARRHQCLGQLIDDGRFADADDARSAAPLDFELVASSLCRLERIGGLAFGRANGRLRRTEPGIEGREHQ
jgi:hypothetical protein